MRIERIHESLPVLAGLVMFTASAGASTVSFTLDNFFSGDTPPTGPWATASLTNDLLPADQVKLTLTGLAGLDAGSSSGYMGNFYLNLSAAYLGGMAPGSLVSAVVSPGQTVQPVSVEIANSYQNTNTSFRPNGDGYFDIYIDLPQSGDRFGAGSTLEIVFSGTGLTPEAFLSRSRLHPSGTDPSGYYIAGHFQGFPGSAWVSGGPSGSPPVIPLPASAGLALAGMVLLGGARRRVH